MTNQYTLMHKNIPVANVELNDEAEIIKILSDLKINEKHFPIKDMNESALRRNLNEWWKYRCISYKRDGIKERIHELGYDDIVLPELIKKCLGFNLTDGYWIKPKGSDLKWEDLNFFLNEYSEKLGELIINERPVRGLNDSDKMSPDPCTGGHLPKQWLNLDGKNCLAKTVYCRTSSAWDYSMEAFNEIVASQIADVLNVPHISYKKMIKDRKIYSTCETVSSEDIEYISADALRNQIKKNNSQNNYQYTIELFELNGIPRDKTIDFFNKMIAFDYLICNEDRHYNNFGLLRDINTCETIGICPLFDNGMSLYYNDYEMSRQTFSNFDLNTQECKPFAHKWDSQIKLITDLSWLDFEKAKREIPVIITSSYEPIIKGKIRTQEAVNNLIRKTMNRLDRLENMQKQFEEQKSQKTLNNVKKEENFDKNRSEFDFSQQL